MKLNPKLRTLLRIGFIVVIISLVVECGFSLFILLTESSVIGSKTWVLLAIYFVTLALTTISCIVASRYGVKGKTAKSQLATRVAMSMLILNFIIAITIFGLGPESLIFLYQIFVLVCSQIYTDEYITHPTRFTNPFKPEIDAYRARERTRAHCIAERDRPDAEAEGVGDEHAARQIEGYIPLNFFNVFWIFVTCSFLGLIIEVLFHAVVFGGYEDRAGLLWGPFSPIYGFGAVLMTIALNRFWDQSKLLIFVVAGLIGAAFEFFVSFFLEYSFGIVAWDYSGTFLNIAGRTNFVFFCVWGFLGLVWIRMLLPDVLKIIDVIPLTWRSTMTVVFAALMLFDGAMTLVTLDCWYQRQAGLPIVNSMQAFCAQEFDDTFMSERFQSMSIDPNLTTRVG